MKKYYLILSPNWEYNDEGYDEAGKELRIKQLFDTKEQARDYINTEVYTQKFFNDNEDIIQSIIQNQHYRGIEQGEIDQLIEAGFTLVEPGTNKYNQKVFPRGEANTFMIYGYDDTWMLNIPDDVEAFHKFEEILGIKLSYGYEICEVEH